MINPYGDGAAAHGTAWFKENFKRFPCGHYDNDDKFFDRVFVHEIDTRCAVGFIGAWLNYLRLDFLDALQPEISQADQVRFGALIDNETGVVLEDWKTVWMPSVPLRSGKGSLYWACETCGKKLYSYSQPCDYVMEADAQNRPIFMANNWLIIRNDIRERLLKHPNWATMKKKIRFMKIKILKEPLDDYPADLSTYDPVIINVNEFSIDSYGVPSSVFYQRLKEKYEMRPHDESSKNHSG